MTNNDEAVVTSNRRLSAIWIVPLVAVFVGIWLAVSAYLGKGPTVILEFSVAEGIEKDKTRIRARSVGVGVVTDVRLNDTLDGVLVTAELLPEAENLLRDDTQFWAVRPTIRGANVTGLGTLLSGAYIEVSPGIGEVSNRRQFKGLESIPSAPAGTPGVRLTMISESRGAVSAGSPISYRGYTVGTVESGYLDVETQNVIYSIFIDAPYDQLVSSNTRFWNASGIAMELGTDGIKMSMDSLVSALVGGVSFDLPVSSPAGLPVTPGMTFRLFPNEASISEDPYQQHIYYVVQFRQSVRGLNSGAPVLYRGLTIGSVEQVLWREMSTDPGSAGTGAPLPVLIKLQPARMDYSDTPEGAESARQTMDVSVREGLYATMESGNILTGARYIGLDVYEDEEPGEMGVFNQYQTLPTINTGFGYLQAQVSELLDKLNGLPVGDTLVTTNDMLSELTNTLAAARTMLEANSMQQLPADLHVTLASINDTLAGFSANSAFQEELLLTLVTLKETLQSARGITDQLNDNPNSFVFPSSGAEDPQPRATSR